MHDDTVVANRLLAFELINERLSIEPTVRNVAILADCMTALEAQNNGEDALCE